MLRQNRNPRWLIEIRPERVMAWNSQKSPKPHCNKPQQWDFAGFHTNIILFYLRVRSKTARWRFWTQMRSKGHNPTYLHHRLCAFPSQSVQAHTARHAKTARLHPGSAVWRHEAQWCTPHPGQHLPQKNGQSSGKQLCQSPHNTTVSSASRVHTDPLNLFGPAVHRVSMGAYNFFFTFHSVRLGDAFSTGREFALEPEWGSRSVKWKSYHV